MIPGSRPRAALLVVITVSRERPHLYQLMFSRPPGDRGVIASATQQMCDHFVAIVSPAVIGGMNRPSR